MGLISNMIFRKLAKGIARAMRFSYVVLREKNPKLTKKELYIQSLQLRPGYYERKYAQSFYDKGMNFRHFVLSVVEQEFCKMNNIDIVTYSLENMANNYDKEFMRAIEKIIPENY